MVKKEEVLLIASVVGSTNGVGICKDIMIWSSWLKTPNNGYVSPDIRILYPWILVPPLTAGGKIQLSKNKLHNNNKMFDCIFSIKVFLNFNDRHQ